MENVLLPGMAEELKSHPDWIAKQEPVAANQAKLTEKLFRKLRFGYCLKCKLYCHGGC